MEALEPADEQLIGVIFANVYRYMDNSPNHIVMFGLIWFSARAQTKDLTHKSHLQSFNLWLSAGNWCQVKRVMKPGKLLMQ